MMSLLYIAREPRESLYVLLTVTHLPLPTSWSEACILLRRIIIKVKVMVAKEQRND